jgi:hypothetical protein
VASVIAVIQPFNARLKSSRAAIPKQSLTQPYLFLLDTLLERPVPNTISFDQLRSRT